MMLHEKPSLGEARPLSDSSRNHVSGSPAVERVLARLPDAKRSGNGWQARCPAHDDREPSLSISQGNDGKVLVHCHAGCSVQSVCEAMGLALADLMPTADTRPTSSSRKGRRRMVATYDYRDEAGTLLFQVVRFEPKDFRQRRPDGNDAWKWDVEGVRVVPYRLHELLADTKSPVFIAEGEKDCDALARLGIVATTNAGGAGKWKEEHSEFLQGRNVIVLPDNDEAGRKHAQTVARSLQGIAKSVRIVELPKRPVKGDVSDWIAAGGTKEELQRLADATPYWTPASGPDFGPVLICMADVEPREVDWLWWGRIPLGRITLLAGRPGEGKSFFTIDAAARVTRGADWPDGSPCPQGSVIFISAEDDPADTIRPRLDAHGADAKRVHSLPAVRYRSENSDRERMITLLDIDQIEAALVQHPDCKLVIVDPIGSFLGSRTDAHRDNEVRAVLAPIAKLAEKYGVAVLIVAHQRKSLGTFADDSVLGSRAFTGLARAVWHLVRDPENKDRRLLLPGKNNLAREGDGLAFRITGEPARIEWEPDPVAMSADDAFTAASQAVGNKRGPEAKALKEAKAWLEAELASGPRLVKELMDEWRNGKRGSERTLKRAKESLEVKAVRDRVPGPWWWQLPSKSANSTKDAELGSLGTLEETPRNPGHFNAVEPKDAKLSELGTLDDPNEGVTA